jgi:hypothetical protein
MLTNRQPRLAAKLRARKPPRSNQSVCDRIDAQFSLMEQGAASLPSLVREDARRHYAPEKLSPASRKRLSGAGATEEIERSKPTAQDGRRSQFCKTAW